MLTPHQFLRELGLTKTPELDDDDVFKEMLAAGVDAGAIHDLGGFGPAAGDAFFATERIARAVLSANFDRLKDQLQQVTSLRGFPQLPDRVADLGGGAGVIGMFVAQRQPEALLGTGHLFTRSGKSKRINDKEPLSVNPFNLPKPRPN